MVYYTKPEDSEDIPKKKKGKGCIIFLAVVLILAAGAFVFFRYALPKLLVKELLSDESTYLSEEQKGVIEQSIDIGVKNLDKYDVSREELDDIMDQITVKNINEILKEFKGNELKDPGELVDAAAKHIDLNDIDLEEVKSDMRRQININALNESIKNLSNGGVNTLYIALPFLKEIVTQSLDKKDM